MVRLPLFLTAFLILSSTSLVAQSVKRLGIIDIETDILTDTDKATLVQFLKDRFSKERMFTLISDQELEDALVEPNRLQAQVEQLKSEHQNRLNELRAHFEEAQKYYQASQFEEAINLLESSWGALKTASLVMDPAFPPEILKLLAACYFFIGKEGKTQEAFATLLDLDSDALLSTQKFPPVLQEIFAKVKKQKRFAYRVWHADSEVHGIRANLLGFPIRFQDSQKISFSLPLEHPILNSQVLVIEKEGYLPLVLSLKSLPKDLHWQSLKEKRTTTKGLFRPIGGNTASPELKNLISKLNLQMVLLASVGRDSAGRWFVRGQLMEEPTGQTTAIVQKNNRAIRDALTEMSNDLLAFVSPEGSLMQAPRAPANAVQNPYRRPTAPLTKSSEPNIEASNVPFYKKWWFWSIVGVAAVGAGVGTYFLLKPEDELKFEVVGP